jgi:hypothetical protein
MLERLKVPKEKHEGMFREKWGDQWKTLLIEAKEDSEIAKKIELIDEMLQVLKRMTNNGQ